MQNSHKEIKRNEKYKEQVVRLHNLKDKYAVDYKAVSEAYWPIFDQTKKRIKNKIYLIGICICLLVVLTVYFILGGLKNEYLIGGLYAICLALLVLAIISYKKTDNAAKDFFKEWNEKNKELYDMQEEIKTLCDDLVEEMIMIICYNTYHYDDNSKDVNLNDWDKNYQHVREEILQATSDSLAYDDVVAYFDEWVDKF